MKDQLMALWTKASTLANENKEMLIRVGGILAGAVVGGLVANAISSAQAENESWLLDQELVAETEETEEE